MAVRAQQPAEAGQRARELGLIAGLLEEANGPLEMRLRGGEIGASVGLIAAVQGDVAEKPGIAEARRDRFGAIEQRRGVVALRVRHLHEQARLAAVVAEGVKLGERLL